MPAIHFIHMHMPDQLEISFEQHWMRLSLVDRVVDIEHGADRRAANLLDDPRRLRKRRDHVRLSDGQRLHENRDASFKRMIGDGFETFDKAPGRGLDRRAVDGGAL